MFRYVPGWQYQGDLLTNLDDWLYYKEKLTEGEVRQILPQILDALEYAHSFRDDLVTTGVVHRDVKPANILLDADGRPLVTDTSASPGRSSRP